MRKVAIWRTGHEIADRVQRNIMYSCRETDYTLTGTSFPVSDNLDLIRKNDAHIAYGILRGTEDVFCECTRLGLPWFNIDRGYIHPGHYDGYYRISLRGTQHTHPIQSWMLDPARLNVLGLIFDQPRDDWEKKSWEKKRKSILVCPPTEEVIKFFNIEGSWLHNVTRQLKGRSYIIRKKGEQNPIDWDAVLYVVTFNSSVGWEALRQGIPCISDPNHSLVGSYFKNIPLDQLADKQLQDRHKLFAVMANLQLSLQEMRDGMLWPLIERLLACDNPS